VHGTEQAAADDDGRPRCGWATSATALRASLWTDHGMAQQRDCFFPRKRAFQPVGRGRRRCPLTWCGSHETLPPRSSGRNAHLRDAVELVMVRRVRHIPIVGANGELIGIITDRDVKRSLPSPLSAIASEEYEMILDGTPVSRVMTASRIRDARRDLTRRRLWAWAARGASPPTPLSAEAMSSRRSAEGVTLREDAHQPTVRHHGQATDLAVSSFSRPGECRVGRHRMRLAGHDTADRASHPKIISYSSDAMAESGLGRLRLTSRSVMMPISSPFAPRSGIWRTRRTSPAQRRRGDGHPAEDRGGACHDSAPSLWASTPPRPHRLNARFLGKNASLAVRIVIPSTG